MTDRPTIASAFKYNAAANDIDLTEAEKRLDGIFEKRSRIAEQSTFGLLALNGASAAAIFSAMQASPQALAALAITSNMLAFSLSAFLLGMVLAVVSVWAETLHLTSIAGKQFARTNVLRNIKKTLSSDLHSESIEMLGSELEELPKVPPMDFAFSPLQTTLHNFAGGAWLGGMSHAIWLVGRNIDWCG